MIKVTLKQKNERGFEEEVHFEFNSSVDASVFAARCLKYGSGLEVCMKNAVDEEKEVEEE